MMSTSYWNGTGLYNATSDQLHKLIPTEGSVANPRKNAALERFRKASNCYYDLYNNGLCNRAAEFRKVFGIQPSRYKIGYGDYSDHLYLQVEMCMNEIIMAAAREQGIALVVSTIDTTTA
jgi:hypothetical protein